MPSFARRGVSGPGRCSYAGRASLYLSRIEDLMDVSEENRKRLQAEADRAFKAATDFGKALILVAVVGGGIALGLMCAGGLR